FQPMSLNSTHWSPSTSRVGLMVAVAMGQFSIPARSRRTCQRALSCSMTSPSSSQEFLDRVVDAFFIADLRERQVFLLLERLFELAIEFARAVGALDLSVAEQVAFWEQLVAEQADAVAVVFAPVVAVGKME